MTDKPLARWDGHYWTCQCGGTMLFLDGPDQRFRRRIKCSRSGCDRAGKIYLEPAFEIEEEVPDPYNRLACGW